MRFVRIKSAEQQGCEFRNKSPTDSEMMLPTYSD
jgi:hypothetical protein